MKVSPIGVQTYQQNQQRPTVENHNDASSSGTVQRADTTSIQPSKTEQSSRLAIQAPSDRTYAEMLTDKERAALDLVFTKYAHRQAEGSEETGLGQQIDVKV